MARIWEWQLDGGASLTATASAFGGIKIALNGQQLETVRGGMGVKKTTLALPTGPAELSYGAPMGVGFRLELRIEGQLVMPVRAPKGAPVAPQTCAACHAAVKAGDRFCDGCGKALPTPEQLTLQSEVKQGNSVVGALSILFIVAGGFLYMGQRAVANNALEQIAGLDASAPLAQPIPGVAAKTIGELREAIEWEANSILYLNLLLAALMFGLWQWGKRNPSAAIIVAFCTYLVIQVTNAALDPRTLGQGWLIKIFVFVYLVRGLKAAIALRKPVPSAA